MVEIRCQNIEALTGDEKQQHETRISMTHGGHVILCDEKEKGHNRKVNKGTTTYVKNLYNKIKRRWICK